MNLLARHKIIALPIVLNSTVLDTVLKYTRGAMWVLTFHTKHNESRSAQLVA